MTENNYIAYLKKGFYILSLGLKEKMFMSKKKVIDNILKDVKIIEEFDACHKFCDKIQINCIKKFGDFSMTHYVAYNNFSIFIEFVPGSNIEEIINYIKKQLLKMICIVTTEKCLGHWSIAGTCFPDSKKEICISFSATQKNCLPVFHNFIVTTLKLLKKAG